MMHLMGKMAMSAVNRGADDAIYRQEKHPPRFLFRKEYLMGYEMGEKNLKWAERHVHVEVRFTDDTPQDRTTGAGEGEGR